MRPLTKIEDMGNENNYSKIIYYNKILSYALVGDMFEVSKLKLLLII